MPNLSKDLIFQFVDNWCQVFWHGAFYTKKVDPSILKFMMVTPSVGILLNVC